MKKYALFIVGVMLMMCFGVAAAGDFSHIGGVVFDPSWGVAGVGLIGSIKELREQRGKLIHDSRAILDAATAEKRELRTDEQEKCDELTKRALDIGKRIELEERQIELEREAAQSAADDHKRKSGTSGEQRAKNDSDERRAAFAKLITRGRESLSGDELRALQSDNDQQGGFLVAPEQFVDQLIKAIDDKVIIRGLATKFRIPTAAKLGCPTLATDVSDADWTAELLTGSEDTGMSYGKRELSPHPLAKRLRISNKLMYQVGGMDALVRSRLAYKFGVAQEKGFLAGNGVNQPLGLFTPSNDGIPTSRDVVGTNTATSINLDSLSNAKYSLKASYQANSSWIFHRDVLAKIATIKNGEGDYMWRPSTIEGEPDRLFGRPVLMSEFAPNTLTTGQYVGIIGDYSNYWIADAMDMSIQVLRELYAETNQIGYVGRMETDGMPVLSEAFARIKLG